MSVRGGRKNPSLHHEICLVITKGDPESQSVLPAPHTNNEYIFLHTIQFRIFILIKSSPKISEYAGMRIIWYQRGNIATLMSVTSYKQHVTCVTFRIHVADILPAVKYYYLV